MIESLTLTIGQVINKDFQLKVGKVTQVVTVTSDHQLVEQSTVAVGHVVDQRMVQQLPLNGRYFLDLGLLLSLYSAYRIALAHTPSLPRALKALAPWALLLILLFAAGVWIVLQPMQMRGTIEG